MEAQAAVVASCDVLGVRQGATRHPVAAARHAAHTVEAAKLRLAQHEPTQHAADARCGGVRHHAEQLHHATLGSVQRTLGLPRRGGERLRREDALSVHGCDRLSSRTDRDVLSRRVQSDSAQQSGLRGAQLRRVPLALQFEQRRKVGCRRQPDRLARRWSRHEPLQRDARVRRVFRVAKQVGVRQQTGVRKRKLPLRGRHQQLSRPRLQRVEVKRRCLGAVGRRRRDAQRVHLEQEQPVPARD